MKKFLFFTAMVFYAGIGFSQTYIPMPADSAMWRYRMYDVDYETQVFDEIIFVNGKDTSAFGHTYHKLISRACIQTVPNDSVPPMTSEIATYSDTYYGAIRDSADQVFQLNLTAEQMIYDFNAVVGDSIPAYSGKDKVTAIDSVMLGGVYHRRFFTNETSYYVIEGVGSNRGILPDINDGTGSVQFICFTDTPLSVFYSPDSTVPCTFVYPIGYVSSVGVITQVEPTINVFPVPSFDVAHITSSGNDVLNAIVFNSIGRVIWTGGLDKKLDIPVGRWPQGVYFVQLTGSSMTPIVRKIIVQ